MKKLILCTIMLLFLVSAAGCSRKEIFITADVISENTMLAKVNGELQVATVEDFGKTYYKLSELEEFVKKEINLYNQKAGGENVKIDNVLLRNGKALMLLTFSGMDHYSAFNNVSAAYFNGGIDNNPLIMPENLVSTKDGSLKNTNEVISNSKYKVLVVNEPYNIIVDGTIKYYSDNATYGEKNTLKSAEEGMTIIVFKP